MTDAPLTPVQLAARWQALCANPALEDLAGKIELTEWGAILVTPVGKSHGLAAMRIAEVVRRSLGGHTKALAYVNAGAQESWLVFPDDGSVEVYAADGRLAATALGVDLAGPFP